MKLQNSAIAARQGTKPLHDDLMGVVIVSK